MSLSSGMYRGAHGSSAYGVTAGPTGYGVTLQQTAAPHPGRTDQHSAMFVESVTGDYHGATAFTTGAGYEYASGGPDPEHPRLQVDAFVAGSAGVHQPIDGRDVGNTASVAPSLAVTANIGPLAGHAPDDSVGVEVFGRHTVATGAPITDTQAGATVTGQHTFHEGQQDVSVGGAVTGIVETVHTPEGTTTGGTVLGTVSVTQVTAPPRAPDEPPQFHVTTGGTEIARSPGFRYSGVVSEVDREHDRVTLTGGRGAQYSFRYSELAEHQEEGVRAIEHLQPNTPVSISTNERGIVEVSGRVRERQPEEHSRSYGLERTPPPPF